MDLYELLKSYEDGQKPTVDEMEAILACNDPAFNNELYATAARVRDREFGKKLFMYSFVYFSTHCKNNCAFCYYRRTNEIDRYRKSKEEIMELAASLEKTGINLIDLTMGEDPKLYANDFQGVIDIVKGVRDTVDAGIMISPGAVTKSTMPRLRQAGADIFACYQETYNRDLFSRIRLEQDYEYRINQRRWARDAGMLTEDGLLVGIGETPRDRAEGIQAMSDLGCQQIRAMTFVPQKGTPLETFIPSDPEVELKAISMMRLLNPTILIPASLDVEGTAGLKTRVAAGANVITSIIPPNENLAGVAQPTLNIDEGTRQLSYVKGLAEGLGRREATMKEFRDYYESHRPEAVY